MRAWTLGTQETDAEGSLEVEKGPKKFRVSFLNTPHGRYDTVDFDYSNLLIEYDLGCTESTQRVTLKEV